MTLDEWRKAKGWNYSDLARAIRITPEAARRICVGLRRMPRGDILDRIRTLTGGKVTADSFVRPPAQTAETLL